MKKHLATLFLAAALFAGAANAEVFVRVAPPAPVRAGVYGVAPGPGYVWVGGFHEWVGGRYAWREGYWAHPPIRMLCGSLPTGPRVMVDMYSFAGTGAGRVKSAANH
jgi:hypothetical protein